MQKSKAFRGTLALLLCFFLIVSSVAIHVHAEDAEISEDSTYVFDRDANGDYLYLYQSPCMLGYDLNNEYGGNGIPIQAWVFNMYNTKYERSQPAYCTDIHVTAVQGSDYRRLNLEDSSFAAGAAGQIRAILQKGFYIIPISGESDADHAARVTAKVAEIQAAAGLDSLTAGEAIAATQAAIWRAAHGTTLTFPKFCRYVFNPTQTKYASLCSYSDLRYKNNTLINETIEAVYNYLLSLEPVAAEEKTVSPASFIKLQKPVYAQNADGTYDVTVTTVVDVDMVSGDSLTLKAWIDDTYAVTTSLSDGKQSVTLTLKSVPASLAEEKVLLSISGYQTAEGFFLFDALGERTESQAMVGYDNSRLPVYAEVEATDSRVLNIFKSASLQNGNGSNTRQPLNGIIFDIVPVATKEEYLSGSIELSDPSNYAVPQYPQYSLITDKDGRASLNFTHHSLPDGVYLIAEQAHPGIVAPIEPFYLFIPQNNSDGSGEIFEITLKPKNDVKSAVRIEKDVISLGNDEATFDAYTSHTWIIGTSIPEDISTCISYVIADTLDNQLDFLGNVQAYLEQVDGSVDAVALIPETDYTLTVTDVDSLSEDKPSDSFKIALTQVGRTKIAEAIGSESVNNYMLRTYFDAQINANAQMGTPIPNQATLQYTSSSRLEMNVMSDIPVVYTGAVNLLKVDALDKTISLPGAVFEVYRTATEEELLAAGDNLLEISGIPGKAIKVSFFNNAAMTGEKVASVTSDRDGSIPIYGLAFGTYYLVETHAPSSYNPLSGPVELTIDSNSHTVENVILVENAKGAVLPATGGSGTVIYTLSGTALICIACLFLYLNKRKLCQA